jgi:enamine deaminase RidA (YjgF/YER057c/UK114 family)
MTIEAKLRALGYELPTPAAPLAAYVPVTSSGNLLFISGQLSTGPDGLVKGHLGKELDVAAGQKAAELCAVNILGQIASVTSLENVASILKLTILVASTPGFSEQHLVGNGASELFIKVLGDPAKHARAAFGVAALPLGAAVEIDAVVEIRN